jgi:hypothetical protein
MAALHRHPQAHAGKATHPPLPAPQRAHATKSVKRFTNTVIAASVAAVVLSMWAAPVSW